LHAVGRSGNAHIARLLLRAGAASDVGDGSGEAPLHIASRYGHVAVVAALLEHHADPNLRATDLRTPVHTAVDYGHEHVISTLVEHGAILAVRDDQGHTPLHLAVMERPFPPPARLLVRFGAAVNIRDNAGNTPLHYAVDSTVDPELGMVPLLRYGADVDVANDNGHTPLMYALSRFKGEEEQRHLRMLVEASVNLDLVIRTPQSQTTLLVRAIETRNTMAIKLLLAHQADVHLAVEQHSARLTAIFHAAFCMDPEQPEIIKLLLDAGANPNERTKGRITPAHICSLKGHPACLKLLLE
jgi:ankyrin repeat protein